MKGFFKHMAKTIIKYSNVHSATSDDIRFLEKAQNMQTLHKFPLQIEKGCICTGMPNTMAQDINNSWIFFPSFISDAPSPP